MSGHILAAASVAAILASSPAHAAADASNQVEELIVTAEKREESLQRTPLAVTALSNKSLETRAIQDVQSLALAAPGLSYNKVSNFVQLAIRGISLEQINLGGEPGVALHQDGVYLARPFVGDATFSDLARVEVLRGPQGTLYGRNATGGSVNLVANEPSSTFAARLGLTIGDYSRARFEGLINGPLGDSVQGRASFVLDRHGGYTRNLANGRELDNGRTGSARAALAFEPSSDIRFVLTADYSREADTGPTFHVGDIPGTAPALGGRTTNDPRTIFIDGPASDRMTSWGVTGKLTWDGPGVRVASTSAYRDSQFRLRSDLDGTDFFLVNEDLFERGRQWSEELQLSSRGDGPLSWLVGGYAFHETGRLKYAFPIPLFGTTITFDSHQKTTAYALYGQARYALTPRLTATVGGRYSYEKKDGSTARVLFVPGFVAVGDSWTAFTPKFGLEFQATENSMLYASVARGFKAGGLNTGSLQTQAYNPEYIWSGEIGSKNRFADGRLQINVTAFIYRYTDLQVNQFEVGQTFITNAASADGKGVEAEFIAKPGAGLTLDGSLSLLDATFDDFKTGDSFRPGLGILDLKGNRLPLSPKFTAAMGLQWDHEVSTGLVTVRLDWAHKGDVYFTPFNESYAHAKSNDLFNVRASLTTGGGWMFAIYGRNLTDVVTLETTTVSGINGGTIVLYGPPRTVGVEVKKSF